MELKEYIIENVELIKKYFSCSSWAYMTAKHHNLELNEVTFMKALFKDNGYKIVSNQKTLTRKNIKKAYKILYRSNLTLAQAIEIMEQELESYPEVEHFLRFLRNVERGVCRGRRDGE